MNITCKLRKAGAAVGAAASAGLMTLATTVTAFAEEEEKKGIDVDGTVKKLSTGSSDGGTFKDLIATITTVGSDMYTLFLTIGVILTLLCIVALGITLGMTKNSGKREESKSWLFGILIACICIFGAPTIVGIIAGIVQAIH